MSSTSNHRVLSSRRAPALIVLALAFVSTVSALPGAAPSVAEAQLVDLRQATIVVRPGTLPAAERTAAQVLVEELRTRIGVTLPIVTAWPSGSGVTIAIASGAIPSGAIPSGAIPSATAPTASASATSAPEWRAAPAMPVVSGTAAGRAEGYRLVVDRAGDRTTIWILGADPRGTLFGVGGLLRALRWGGSAQGVPSDLDVATAPRYPIRGHQLGYRHHSNTYDGWDARQYEQYIRELALFGANSIENIPFQDTRVSPHFPLSRAAMNVAISEICARYDLDYWIWTPADFDLTDRAKRAQALAELDTLFATLPRLDAIFFPGGDPGHNPAPLVLPYLAEVAARLQRHHPRAKVWLSLQWFDAKGVDFVYDVLHREQPAWFGGLVAGPSSPAIPATRARLDPRWPLRDYPDITHTVRCQYEVPWWDPAFALTLGREPINPRPVFYAAVHDRLAPYTHGFISYSDGVNDDLNKALWSRKGWSPEEGPREILIEYARLFFGDPIAARAADGILALEKNWEGPLATNGSVDATLTLWQELEREHAELATNWRWQMCLLRAYYDAFTRQRLIAETAIERAANDTLARAGRGPDAKSAAAAIADARALLRGEAVAGDASAGCCTDWRHWRQRIEALGDALFKSIRMQTSMKRHQASGAERGAVLDFLETPLNNRWWLEDEFVKVERLPDEAARLARLHQIGTWEEPGAGSFYDVVGDVGRAPHVVRAQASSADPFLDAGDTPHFSWEQDGQSRKRRTWLNSLRWPLALEYGALDRKASYVVRLNGTGDVRLRIDGAPVEPATYSRTAGEPKEYRVPAAAIEDGRVVLTFDPIDESHLNWRQHSRLSEVWLIKQPASGTRSLEP